MSGYVYIAGPMSGIAEWNYPAFHAAAEELRGGWADLMACMESES